MFLFLATSQRGGCTRDAGLSLTWSSVVIRHHKHWSEGVKLSSWRSFVVSSVICHAVKDVEGAYQRSDMLDRRRPLTETWAQHVEQQQDFVNPTAARS